MREDIAVVNVAIIAVTVYTTIQGFRNEGLIERYLFSTEGILRRREHWRLVSGALVHSDWVHLIFNMYSLYSFGSWIEWIFGPVRFGAIYVSGIIGGSLLALLLHRGHEYRALGASGGVCGVIFASIFLLPGGSVLVFPIPFAVPAWAYAILFIGYSLFGIRSQMDNIGHDAHLGGAIVGLATATAMEPWIVRESPVLYSAVMGLSVAAFLYLYAMPLYLQGARPVLVRRRWKGRSEASYASNEDEEPGDEETLELLLEKISREGMGSLTEFERRQLERIRERKTD